MQNLTLHKQSGLSIVELMVAITLGTILLAGILQIFVFNKRSFEITQDLSHVQESARIGIQVLSKSIRNADHWGSVDLAAVSSVGTIAVAASGACDKNWALNGNGVVGYEGAATIPAAASCLGKSANYQANSDILVLRYADASQLTGTPASGTLYLRSNPENKAVIFDGADLATAKAQVPDGTMIYNYGYQAEMFVVRKCAQADTSGNCIAGSPPALVRVRLGAGPKMTEQVLVEGIEQMQLQYGLDVNGDLLVDRYVGAGSVTNWQNVVAVRVALLARSRELDLEIDNTAAFSTALLDYTYTVPANDSARRYRRMVMQRDIFIRNRVGSLSIRTGV